MTRPDSKIPPRYEVLAELGRGGFGVVYRTRDRELDREVALKILRLGGDDTRVERFQREARVLARLDHPHILRVFDHGTAGEHPFLVTELVEGRELSDARPEDPLAVMLDVAAGLQTIHDAGLVHRDVKPANILLTEQGRAVLLDLGLVSGEELDVLTATGMVVGTPAFMAPELLQGEEATPRSDWFAWGVSLERLLDEDAPAAARRVAAACQAADPEERPRDLAAIQALAEGGGRTRVALASAGLESGAGPPVRDRRGLLAVTAATGLALVGGFAWWSARPAPELVPLPSAEPVEVRARLLGEDLERDLRAELDAAFQVRVEVPTFAGGSREVSFPEALSERGIGALDALPRHVEVLRWFAEGGDPAALHPEEVAVLEAHDRALGDLGLPPAFGPFLAATPYPEEAPVRDPAPEVRALREAFAEGLRDAARGWDRAAEHHLADAVAAREHVLERIREEGLGAGGMSLLAQDPQRPGEARLLNLRGSAAGRDAVRSLVGPGREHVRAYLLAARRALDGARPEQARELAGVADSLFQEVSVLFLGAMRTASRDRLFGAPPASPAAAVFEARVLKHLRILRDRTATPHGALAEDELAARRRAVEAARESGDARLLAQQVADLLLRMDGLQEDAKEIERVYRTYRERLGGLPGLTRRKVSELLERRDLPALP